MQISAPPGILMQFSRSVKSSWAKALVNNYGKRKERLTPEFQTIWHLMRFSSAIGNLRSIRFRIISKMRNGNDDFSTSSIEQPNGSSQKHHTRTQSLHTCQNWVWYLFCKLFAICPQIGAASDPSVFKSSAKWETAMMIFTCPLLSSQMVAARNITLRHKHIFVLRECGSYGEDVSVNAVIILRKQ